MSQAEIAHLQREERFKDIGNRIADCVCYDLMGAPKITNRLVADCVDKAASKFSTDLPRGIIAMIVSKQAEQEVELRGKIAVLRAQKVERKRRRRL